MSAARPVLIRLSELNRTSVAALAAVLETELGGITPELLASADEVVAPALVLCSFMTPQAEQVAREVRQLRRRHGAEVVLMAGGPHPSGDPARTLALGFDLVVVGEAGPRFAALVQAAAAGEPPVRGIVDWAEQPALDAYPPWPLAAPRLFTPIEITRGCPMACAFCQTPRLFGRRVRHRSVAALRRVLRRSAETGHRFTRFITPNALSYGATGHRPNLQALEALLTAARAEGMERIYLGTFPSEVRPEWVTAEALELLRALCDNRSISVGLQSGSEAVLRRLRRGHTVAEGRRAVERIAAAGFVPRVDLIFGFPGETDAERAETRQLAREVTAGFGGTVHLHRFTPLPGSPLAAAPPSPIDPATAELVKKLRRRGQATGWSDEHE